MAISLRYQRRIVSGGDDARDLRQDPPAEFVTAHSESTTLGVRQAKRPRAQVFSEDPILLPEIVDQIVLVTVHPASEREDEELQRRRHSLRLLGRLDQHRPSLGRFFAPYAVELGSPFTWSQGESLDELEQPERVAQIRQDHEQRLARMKSKVPQNPLRRNSEPLDIDDLYGQAKVCLACHK